MARIFPTELPAERSTRGEEDERETLELLRGLPEDYTIYYSQNWLDIKPGKLFKGEIDFVIVRDDGAVILLEQKSGNVLERGDRLIAEYADGQKDVIRQSKRNEGHLLSRLKKALSPAFAKTLILNSLLYFPNSHINADAGVDIDPSMIHHAGSTESLVSFITRNSFKHPKCPLGTAAALHQFFYSKLNIRPCFTRAINQQRIIYRSMTGDVASLLLGFEMQPFRLRIQGTAGSGKTQYGLRVAERAAGSGRRVLYLCFNRLLAEELQDRAPTALLVATFHEYCEQLLRASGKPLPDCEKSDPRYWKELEHGFAVLDVEKDTPESHRFDLIVIDEGQDFHEAWFHKLKRLLRDDASGMLWMEDPDQRVQRSESFELPPGFASWHLHTNYRTTREIAEYIAVNLGFEYASGTGHTGPSVVQIPWSNESEQASVISAQVRKWRDEGIPADQIVILSVLGRDHSPLLALDSIGGCRLRKATGQYRPEDGREIFTDGELLIETVRRFKGLEAPCVIVADIDPTKIVDNPDFRKLLFVAMSRAMIGLAVAFKADNPMNKKLN